jgi:hypothetical protein
MLTKNEIIIMLNKVANVPQILRESRQTDIKKKRRCTGRRKKKGVLCRDGAGERDGNDDGRTPRTTAWEFEIARENRRPRHLPVDRTVRLFNPEFVTAPSALEAIRNPGPIVLTVVRSECFFTGAFVTPVG